MAAAARLDWIFVQRSFKTKVIWLSRFLEMNVIGQVVSLKRRVNVQVAF
jgi:hypothetical protein